MNKLFILPLLLLASCTTLAPRPSYMKAGDVLQLTGTTKDGKPYAQSFTLRDNGRWEDQYEWWRHETNGRDFRSADVFIDPDAEMLIIMDEISGEVGVNTTYSVCIAILDANSQNWRSATGALLIDTSDGISNIFKNQSALSQKPSLQQLARQNGSCTVKR